MNRLILIALLAFTGVIHASISAAWKVPVEHFAPDHENNNKVRKLEKPPGESGFFKPGDELWDVAKSLATGASWEPDPFEEPGPKQPWAGEWAVWNARSEMLVAHGDYIDILEAQQASCYNGPRMIRTSFELVQGTRKQSISTLALSGEKGVAQVDGIEVETDAWSGLTDFHDIRCAVSWNAVQKGSRWNVVTSFVGQNGKDVLVARHGAGDSAWELHATVSQEIIGGTRVAEARWIEVGQEDPRPWPEGNVLLPTLARQPLKDGLFIAAYQAPTPFGSGPPPPDMEAPATLRGWIHGPFLNVAKNLKDAGIDSDLPGFFAGVELRSSQLLLVADNASHDRVAAVLKDTWASPETVVQIESSPEAGNWSLLVRSEEKALISLERGDEDLEIFEIQPALAEEHTTVDLKYKCSRPETPSDSTERAANLKVGEWLEVEGVSRLKTEPRFALRATVLNP